MQETTIKILSLCACLVLAGCITAIDSNLPYTELPEITMATEFYLIASPTHPSSKLFSTPISGGQKVRVIATDKNSAGLLVEYENRLGWMPSFYSRTPIGTLEPAVEIDPLPSGCTQYIGAVTELEQVWESDSDTALIIIGSIYQKENGTFREDTTLSLKINQELANSVQFRK